VYRGDREAYKHAHADCLLLASSTELISGMTYDQGTLSPYIEHQSGKYSERRRV